MLTVLLGAGFSEGVHLPGTLQITDHIRQLPAYGVRGDDYREAPIGNVLWKIANAYYDQPNFETLLHLSESMISANRSRFGFTLPDTQKVAFNAFMEPARRWERVLEDTALSRFGTEMMANIADFIDAAIRQSSPEKQGIVAGFFEPLFKITKVRIATLNYDDAIERSVPDLWDGFTDGNPGTVDYSGFAHEYPVELLHLHGSIRFAPPAENARLLPELRRFATNDDAKPHRMARQDLMFFSQAGEVLFNGPMLSGLRKTEKLLLEPYGLYHQRLIEGILRSPRLICIGYGGNDTYVNAAISLARRVHGPDFRAVYITKLAPDADFRAPSVFRSLLLAASHSITYENEYHAFTERIRASAYNLQENGMMLIATGFPLNGEAHEEMMQFLFA